MKKRYFNWKLAITLIIAIFVLGATAVALRKWQKTSRAQSAHESGNLAYEEMRWLEAAKDIGQYLTANPEDTTMLFKYADAQMNIRPSKQNNLSHAIESLKRILRYETDNIKAAQKLTDIYLAIQLPAEAELIAQKILQEIDDARLATSYALALVEQRKFEEATKSLSELITTHPEHITAYEVLGYLNSQRPEFFQEKPIHWFNEAIKNNPTSSLAYTIRGVFYFRTNQQQKALADLQTAQEQELSDPNALMRLATELTYMNLLEEAEQQLKKLRKIKPDNLNLWRTWATVAMKYGSADKIKEVADEALANLKSQPLDFMPTAVELFIITEDFQQAESCLQSLREKDISPATVEFLQGLLSDKKGDLSEAVEAWKRAINLGYKTLKLQLSLASTLIKLGDTNSALRQLNQLVSENPDSVDGHLALAQLYGQLGNWDQSTQHAKTVMELSPNNSSVTLLYLQGRSRLLGAKQDSSKSSSWKEIEDELNALDNNSNEIQAKLLKIQLKTQQSDFTNAQLMVNELKEQYPDQLSVSMAEVELLIAQNKFDQAITELQVIVEKHPTSARAVQFLASLFFQQQKHGEAEIALRDTLTRVEYLPDKRKLTFLLADLLRQMGHELQSYDVLVNFAKDFENDIPTKRRLLLSKNVINESTVAQELVDQIKKLEGSDGWQWKYEQARLWARGKQFDKYYPQIVELLQENLLANPEDQDSRLLLAQVHEAVGNIQLALSTYKQLLDRSPHDLRVIIPTVAALYKAKEYEEADKIINRASKENLHHPQLTRFKLQSNLRHGELEQASDIMSEFLHDDPNDIAVSLSLALLKMHQKQFAEAAFLLEKLKTLDPNSLPVIAASVQLNILQDQGSEAIKLCDKAVETLKTSSSYILRGRTYTTLNKNDKALEDFNMALSIDPESTEALTTRSDFFSRTKQLENAIVDIQKALKLAPDNLQVQKRAIALFIESQNPELFSLGRELLEKAFSSNPDDAQLGLIKVRLLLSEPTALNIAEASGILDKITTRQPEVLQAWVLLSEIYLRSANSGKAIATILRGLSHNSNDRSLLLLKAQAEATESASLAIPTLSQLRQLFPDDIEIAIRLAAAYSAAGRHQEAINLLEEQIEAANEESGLRTCRTALAVALFKNGDTGKSQSIFESLRRDDPSDLQPFLAQCRLLSQAEQWVTIIELSEKWTAGEEENLQAITIVCNDLIATGNKDGQITAEAILRTSLENAPENVPLMQTLALLLQITGRESKAALLYERILTVAPQNIVVINNLAWIKCENQQEYERSLELANTGLKLSPNYVDLIDTRGVVYYRTGQLEKAIADFSACINLYPASSPGITTSHFHLARSLANLGQSHKAIEHLRQALNFNTRIGGLSAADLNEAQSLLKKLSQRG